MSVLVVVPTGRTVTTPDGEMPTWHVVEETADGVVEYEAMSDPAFLAQYQAELGVS